MLTGAAVRYQQPLKKHAAITAACLSCWIFILRRYYYIYSPSYYYSSLFMLRSMENLASGFARGTRVYNRVH